MVFKLGIEESGIHESKSKCNWGRNLVHCKFSNLAKQKLLTVRESHHVEVTSIVMDAYWCNTTVGTREHSKVDCTMDILYPGFRPPRGNCSKRYCCIATRQSATRLHTDSRMPLARDPSRRCYSHWYVGNGVGVVVSQCRSQRNQNVL